MTRFIQAIALMATLIMSTPLAAQEKGEIDYQAWESLATQAETLYTSDEVSIEQLLEIRTELMTWRSRLQKAENVNANSIEVVRQQLEALGPPPAEGETEPDDVAAQRATLKDELDTLLAPRLKAEAAFSHANAMIGEIDDALAEKRADLLARPAPSPLLPSSWSAAVADGGELVEGIAGEAFQRSSDKSIWAQMRPNLLEVAGYLLAAVLALTLGRQWVRSLPSRLSARASDYSRAVVAFVVSLGQIAIPVIGLYLLVRAVDASGLPGEWTQPFWLALAGAGLTFFAGNWLARQLFPKYSVAYETLRMDDGVRRSLRRMVNVLAAIFAVHYLLSRAALPLSGLYELSQDKIGRVPMDFSDAGAVVWHFLLILLGGLTLYRIGHDLHKLNPKNADMPVTTRHKILASLGWWTRIVAVISVLLAAVGFVNLANAIIWPWVLSLALVGLLILLQDFSADMVNMIKRGEEGAREGLVPLIIGFVLIVLSVPLFMFIWGASGDDLYEYWGSFQRGISLGGINLSPGTVLTFLIVFAIGYMLTRAIQRTFRNSVLPRTKLDSGGQNAIVSGLGYVGIMLAALIAITSAGIDLSSLAIVAGALSVGIGFGLQNIVSNFVSGIILLIERPISVGDWIEAGGQQGIVKRISVRSTQVETFDRTDVIVPNSDLISQPVTNWTRSSQTGRVIIPVGVAYGTDTRKVARILQEIIEDQPLVTVDPAPFVLFRGFGESSLNFEIRAILSDVGSGVIVTSDVCHIVAERFAEEGIEMPFAQRDIWLRNPETLRESLPVPGREPNASEPPTDRQAPELKPDPRLAFDDPESDGDSS